MRFGRWMAGLVAIVAVAGGVLWVLTEPRPLSAEVVPAAVGDAAKGELLFWAGGCVSCHLSPDAKATDAKPMLGGGKALTSKFGTFYPPNISPDKETGIGNWTTLDFVNAMKRGIAPDRTHLYPSFPYTSYQRMTIPDLVDLKTFMDTLPAVQAADKSAELPFPLNIRRGLGLWKLMFLDGKEFAPDPVKADDVNRGGYLVNGPGHCNECHTARTLFGLGGLDYAHALGGAPNPSGRGRVPNLTPGTGGIGDKSADDLLFDLQTGLDFNGQMLEVQQNLAHLPEGDLAAIVAYLKQIAPVDGPVRRSDGGSGGS